MNIREMRRTKLETMLVWAVQQALRPFGRGPHPDHKRQRAARDKAVERRAVRRNKANPGAQPELPDTWKEARRDWDRY